MKKIFFVLLAILLINCTDANSQGRIIVKKILDELGSTAQAFMLSANRPSYGISSYTTPKNKLGIDISAAFNNDFIDVPVSLSYGISDNIELQTGISAFTKSYNFSGEIISGLGDADVGFKYKFQESDNFEHAFQLIIKIPTASSETQLGTGKIDFHLGLAQGFYFNNFSYDLSAELNFLKRRNLPDIRKIPKLLQPAYDSILNVYNYKYEKEIVFSLSPAYYIGQYAVVYSGISFSRNLKLDYNSLQIYGGLGFSLSEKVSISSGAAFGLLKEKSWIVSTGINLLL